MIGPGDRPRPHDRDREVGLPGELHTAIGIDHIEGIAQFLGDGSRDTRGVGDVVECAAARVRQGTEQLLVVVVTDAKGAGADAKLK
jgi:hypothetical protein